MILKLDLDKDYDRLKWSFIRETLEDARLPSALVDVIIRCISKGDCRFLWNGEVTWPLSSSRRLKQGDPLSLFVFFVLYMERLAQWIEAMKCAKHCCPLRLQDQAHQSHICFLLMMFYFLQRLLRIRSISSDQVWMPFVRLRANEWALVSLRSFPLLMFRLQCCFIKRSLGYSTYWGPWDIS